MDLLNKTLLVLLLVLVLHCNGARTNVFGGGTGQAGVDAGYIILCAYVVYTMQTGFALLESGFCTKRSQANIMAKNLIDVCIGGIAYWFIGYGFSFGPNTKPSRRMSGEGLFVLDVDHNDAGNAATYIYYFFHLSFATATATITSGAVAERIKLGSYMIFAVIDTSMIYPFCCHWVWDANGFLQPYVLDFAGSGAVHMCGGASALAGALALGPRKGRFMKGNEKFFQMASPTNVVLGTFFLWWGWIGFNCGCQAIISGSTWQLVARISVVTVNCAMAGAFSAIVVSFIRSPWRGYLLDIGEVCGSLLGGLVAICSPAANIRPWEALIIGLLGGLTVIGSNEIMFKLKVDDPVGAFSVHWSAGFVGLILAGFFADHADPNKAGVFRLGNGKVLGWNILEGLVVTVWSFGVSMIVFMALKYTIGLRVTPEEEYMGSDGHDHNVLKMEYTLEEYKAFCEGKASTGTSIGIENKAEERV